MSQSRKSISNVVGMMVRHYLCFKKSVKWHTLKYWSEMIQYVQFSWGGVWERPQTKEVLISDCVESSVWGVGFIILFFLLSFIFKISIMKIFLKQVQSHFSYLGIHCWQRWEWTGQVTTCGLAHLPFVIQSPTKTQEFPKLIFHVKVVLLLLLLGSADGLWLLVLQALESPAMGITPKTSPKPLRIAC
jgi:hypothetical protein